MSLFFNFNYYYVKNVDNSTNISPLSRIGTALLALTVFNTMEWCGYLENSLPSANQNGYNGGKYSH